MVINLQNTSLSTFNNTLNIYFNSSGNYISASSELLIRCYNNFNGNLELPNGIEKFKFTNAPTNFNGKITLPNSIKDISSMLSNGGSNYNQVLDIPENTLNTSSLFYQCYNYNYPTYIPNSVEDCSNMFMNCSSLNYNIYIGTNVKNCYQMLHGATNFNQPITIPKNVENCANMLRNCINFNSPITFDERDIITNCAFMFEGATSFNRPLSFINGGYYISGSLPTGFNSIITIENCNISYLGGLLANCINFNKPIYINANISSGTGLFNNSNKCANFNSNIYINGRNNSDISKILGMNYMNNTGYCGYIYANAGGFYTAFYLQNAKLILGNDVSHLYLYTIPDMVDLGRATFKNFTTSNFYPQHRVSDAQSFNKYINAIMKPLINNNVFTFPKGNVNIINLFYIYSSNYPEAARRTITDLFNNIDTIHIPEGDMNLYQTCYHLASISSSIFNGTNIIIDGGIKNLSSFAYCYKIADTICNIYLNTNFSNISTGGSTFGWFSIYDQKNVLINCHCRKNDFNNIINAANFLKLFDIDLVNRSSYWKNTENINNQYFRVYSSGRSNTTNVNIFIYGDLT